MGSFTRPITSAENAIIQKQVNNIYNTFTKRVSDGRSIPQASVDSIGQGRVWSGTDALHLHLVDTLGGINDAIAMAARMAKLDNYRIRELPELKQPIQKILEDMNEEAHVQFIKEQLTDEQFKLLNASKMIMHLQGIQSLMMYDLHIE